MSNYKKDRIYIKQRLEYVSPVDYISKLEEKIEYLEYLKNENERLNNIIDELEEYLQNRCNYFDEMQVDYMKDCSKEYEEIDNVLDKLKELKEK